eukprot:jgi/Mesvir1/24997/Mv16955-RA.1
MALAAASTARNFPSRRAPVSVLVLGKSGAGKTTTLNALLGSNFQQCSNGKSRLAEHTARVGDCKVQVLECEGLDSVAQVETAHRLLVKKREAYDVVVYVDRADCLDAPLLQRVSQSLEDGSMWRRGIIVVTHTEGMQEEDIVKATVVANSFYPSAVVAVDNAAGKGLDVLADAVLSVLSQGLVNRFSPASTAINAVVQHAAPSQPWECESLHAPSMLSSPDVKQPVQFVLETAASLCGAAAPAAAPLRALPQVPVASLSLAAAACTLTPTLALTMPHVREAKVEAVQAIQRIIHRDPPKAPAAPGRKKPSAPARTAVASSSVSFATVAGLGVALPVREQNSTSSAAVVPDALRMPEMSRGTAPPRGVAGARGSILVWLRNDLRVHDHEALARANDDASAVMPVFVFDPRDYGKSASGFDKTGPYRAKFLLECVADLRANLRAKGSDLVVRVGHPEEVLPQLAKKVGARALYYHQEVTYEEMSLEAKVEDALSKRGIEAKSFWGSTLFHVDDLPFDLQAMPSNYGGFREKVAGLAVRPVLPAASQLKGLPMRGGVEVGEIPTLAQLDITPPSTSGKQEHLVAGGAPSLTGGETEALQRLQGFVVEAVTAERQGKAGAPAGTSSDGAASGNRHLYGANFSCKISPWLAMGCLSPRRMYDDLRRNGGQVAARAGAAQASGEGGLNWLVFELLWRDFFRFITKKYGQSRRLQTANAGASASAPLAMAAA